MINKKILPVYEEPPVLTRNEYTHQLSIALTNKKAFGWLAENYIQTMVYYEGDLSDIEPNFYDFTNNYYFSNTAYNLVGNNKICPFLDFYRHSYEDYKRYKLSIVDYLKLNIQNNFYIFLYLDVSLISAYHLNGTYYQHCPLIIGYDNNEKIFYFRDYCDLTYSTYKASYSEIESAFNSFTSQDYNNSNFKPFYDYGVNLIKLQNADNYDFSIIRTKALLYDYINGENIKSQYLKVFPSTNFYYGLNIIDIIISLIEASVENNRDELGSIFKFSIIIDQKTVMLLRMNYLKEFKIITNESYERLSYYFEKSLHCAKIIQNLYLKYQFTNDKAIVYKIISHLKHLKDMDSIYIGELISIL